MSDQKRQTAQTSWPSTSSAANVAIALKTLRGTQNPPDAVLAILRSGPRSFPELMRESKLDFSELDEALTRLEKRALIVAEGEGENRVYRLTESGSALGS